MATPTYEIFPGGAVRETTQRYYEPRPHSSEVPRDASITPNRIRSPSPSRLGHGQPHSSPGIGRAAGFDHAPGSRNVSTGSGIGGSNGDGGLSLDRIGKAIVSRAARAARRGNLPFLVIFLSSLIFFFSALAGIGYVDPESVAAAPVADFQPGSPVYNREESVISHGKKADEQKELERSWQRKKRPKDGAWMQVQRDDKAVRRVPVKPPVVEQVDTYDDSIPDLKDGAEQEGLDRREFELSDPERVDDDVADETNAALAEKVRDDDAAALAKEKAEVKAQVKAAEDRKMIVQKAKLDAEIAQLEEAETGDEV